MELNFAEVVFGENLNTLWYDKRWNTRFCEKIEI